MYQTLNLWLHNRMHKVNVIKTVIPLINHLIHTENNNAYTLMMFESSSMSLCGFTGGFNTPSRI